MRLRHAQGEDSGFLTEMLAVAVDWRTPAAPRPVSRLLLIPEVAHYVSGWPRRGDAGVVAEEDAEPIGAAWFRFFTEDDAGYGFVDSGTPELTVGVRRPHRGRGAGTALLVRLIETAVAADLPALSLSVEQDNRARRLYERLGFVDVGRDAGGSVTMLRRLAR